MPAEHARVWHEQVSAEPPKLSELDEELYEMLRTSSVYGSDSS